MESLFDTLVAKISAANEMFKSDNPSIHQSFYQMDKIPETNKIYHNNFDEYKSRKIAERELKRPWEKLSVNYKIIVILNFLKEYKVGNPGINLNLVYYDTLLNIDKNKGLEIKTEYNGQAGKLRKLFGYTNVDNKIVKGTAEDFISNKFIFRLRYKSGYRPVDPEIQAKIIGEFNKPKKIVGGSAIITKKRWMHYTPQGCAPSPP